MSRKTDLRKRMAQAREALSPGDAAGHSAAIRGRVLETPEVLAARSLFTYVSRGNEVDTRELIRELIRRGKTILVPLITGEGLMEAHRIERLADLQPGKFGILAPEKPNPFGGTPDVTICPGVAFSRRGGRLGRGKGYYDRFLEKHPGTFAMALGYEFQVLEEVPVEEGDRPVGLIITEKRSIRI